MGRDVTSPADYEVWGVPLDTADVSARLLVYMGLYIFVKIKRHTFVNIRPCSILKLHTGNTFISV